MFRINIRSKTFIFSSGSAIKNNIRDSSTFINFHPFPFSNSWGAEVLPLKNRLHLLPTQSLLFAPTVCLSTSLAGYGHVKSLNCGGKHLQPANLRLCKKSQELRMQSLSRFNQGSEWMLGLLISIIRNVISAKNFASSIDSSFVAPKRDGLGRKDDKTRWSEKVTGPGLIKMETAFSSENFHQSIILCRQHCSLSICWYFFWV